MSFLFHKNNLRENRYEKINDISNNKVNGDNLIKSQSTIFGIIFLFFIDIGILLNLLLFKKLFF